ncbi:FAD-binding monooxygenase [Parasphingopyxis algicola]|uniref:NAD(P)/FAD-dependent oxidoreductase n=1 Tax=Parasphingopyxis algicola TaxID=2026624 RepID=UPI00159FDEC8|nr:FAD-dependent monooxygenase [Parasphingopyxis algicola]QLC25623.1 FAD-binding monooxygenase [Parasphingopyxis algicola]
MHRTAALIAGGGPAGLTAAIALARGGAEPLVLERHAETPDLLCGGFLSWQTLETLKRIGLESGRLGGHAIDRVGIFVGDRSRIARLPRPGMGLSRRRLDTLLREEAEAAGAEIRRGVALSRADGPGDIRLGDGGAISADALFLATGKYELRGLKRPVEREDGDAWMGLRWRIPASAKLRKTIAGAIELHLFGHGYAGLLLQEDGSANLCMAVRRSRLRDAGGDPMDLLDRLALETPSLGERLAGETLPGSADAVSRVPYGWRMRDGRHGLFRIGDQGAVIPSLAGEGIGIALASGEAAAQAYLRGGPAAAVDFQRNFARAARRPIAVASALKKLADHPRLARHAIGLAAMPGLVGLLGEATRIRA